jgi:hypothetical protein
MPRNINEHMLWDDAPRRRMWISLVVIRKDGGTRSSPILGLKRIYRDAELAVKLSRNEDGCNVRFKNRLS